MFVAMMVEPTLSGPFTVELMPGGLLRRYERSREYSLSRHSSVRYRLQPPYGGKAGRDELKHFSGLSSPVMTLKRFRVESLALEA